MDTYNKMTEIVEDPVLTNPQPGQCYYYHEGTAELLLCTKEADEDTKSANLINGFLFNNGTTDLCDLMIEPFGIESSMIQSVWPNWANDEEKGQNPFVLKPKQTIEIGESL